MIKFILILFTLMIFIPSSAFADVSISLRLNRYDAALVDSVRMTVSISGSRDSDEPQIAGLENFLVQKGGRSSQVQIINGRVSSNLDFTYLIQPKRTGVFDIGPATVKIDGKTYQSNSEKLTVKNSVDQKGNVKDPVFLTASMSTVRAYLEEQILYTLRLYYIPQISNLSLAIPEADGLAFKQLGKPVEYNTTYNSRNYQVVEIRYSLTPSKTGQFNINPAKMSMSVHMARNDNNTDDLFSMDDFFANVRGKAVTLASNSLILNVLPVPDIGKPADYTGLVGSFRISAKLDPARLKAGESATLTVTLKGSGNFNRAPDLKIPDIENIKIYSDEPKLETQQAEKGLEGEKIMKWAIVPVKEGRYTIPRLSISYFDSIGKYYNIIRTTPFTLIADPGSGEIAQSPFIKPEEKKTGKEVEELGKDILPIHKSVKGLSVNANAIGLFSWLSLVLPILIYGFVITLNKITKMTPQREAQLKAFRAAPAFYKKCKNKDISADFLSVSLKDYINSRLSMDMGSFAPQEVANLLKGRGCSEETLNQIEWVLKKIEALIYTGKGNEPCDLTEEAILIVKSIEKEIK